MIYLFTAVTLALGMFHSTSMFLIALTELTLVTLYNLKVKKTLFFANFIIAIWATIPIILVAYITGSWNIKIIFVSLSLLLLVTANEILCDIPDVIGDRATGRSTFASVFGNKGSLVASFTHFAFSYLVLIGLRTKLQSPKVIYAHINLTYITILFLFAIIFRKKPIVKGIRDYQPFTWMFGLAFALIYAILAISN